MQQQQQQQQAAAAAAAQQQQPQTQQQRAGQAGLKVDGGAAFDPASAANADREDDASGTRQQWGMFLIPRLDDRVRRLPCYIGQPLDIWP